MSELTGQAGELRAIIHITRKETGKVETYELVGPVTPEQHEQLMETIKRCVHGTSGAIAGPGAILQPALMSMHDIFSDRRRDE